MCSFSEDERIKQEKEAEAEKIQEVLSYWNDISQGFKPRKNRLIATGLTPKVSDLSTTPSSAGAPGPPTPQEGVRAPAEVGDRFL